MKKLVISAVFGLVCAAIFAQTATIRIGYIDKKSVLAAMPQTIDAEKKYQADLALYNAEYSRMESEYHQKVKEYLESGKNSKEAIKMALQTEIAEYEARLATFKMRYTKDLNRERQEKMDKAEILLNETAKTIAKQQNINLVLDQATPIFADSTCINLTDLVKKALIR